MYDLQEIKREANTNRLKAIKEVHKTILELKDHELYSNQILIIGIQL